MTENQDSTRQQVQATWDLFIPGLDGKIPTKGDGKKLVAGHLYKRQTKDKKHTFMEGFINLADGTRVKLIAFRHYQEKKEEAPDDKR